MADKGWSWIVLSGAFINCTVVGGIAFSFGLLYIEMLDNFNSSRAATSWVGSLLFGMQHLAGPFVSVILGSRSSREVVCTGGIMAACGLLVGAFCPSLVYLYISVGLVSGLGFAMIFLPTNVTAMKYFEKKKGFAIGLISSGAGVGSFIFNPLVQYLIRQYTWRGTLIIEAGIVLNCVVCGSVFRSVDKAETKADEQQLEQKVEDKILVPGGKFEHGLETCTGREQNETSCSIAGNETVDYELNQENMKTQNRNQNDIVSLTTGHVEASKHKNTIRKICLRSFTSVADVLHINLLKDPLFVLFYIAAFTRALPLYIPYMYLTDLALKRGASAESAVWLIPMFGIINIFGRTLAGLLVDKFKLKPLTVYIAAIFVSGVLCLLVPLFKSIGLLMAYTVLLAVTTSSLRPVTPLVLSHMFGSSTIADSFGLLLSAFGAAILIGPTIAGFIYDRTGSFNLSFISAGLEFLAGGIMLLFIPLLRKIGISKST